MTFWTPERVETLKRLDAEGKAASEIAAVLGGGISRNAVLGKLARAGIVGARVVPRTGRVQIAMRLAPPHSARTASAPPKPPRLSRVLPRKAAAETPAVQPAPKTQEAVRARLDALAAASRAKSLVELGQRECKFPLDDPGSGMMDRVAFCAAPCADGEPYCPGHVALVFNKTPAPYTPRPGRRAA